LCHPECCRRGVLIQVLREARERAEKRREEGKWQVVVKVRRHRQVARRVRSCMLSGSVRQVVGAPARQAGARLPECHASRQTAPEVEVPNLCHHVLTAILPSAIEEKMRRGYVHEAWRVAA